MTQDSEWTDLLQQWKGGQAAELPVDTLLAGAVSYTHLTLPTNREV